MNAKDTLSKTASAGMLALTGVSLAHLLNDAMQSAIPAVFPIFQQSMQLSFAQIGWIAFALNVTASVLQPLVGYYTDKRPTPLLLPAGMIFSLLGMIGFAYSANWWMLIASALLLGIGSSVLHPESSRVAHLASAKGRGLAQSIFQVGGNTGQALAPLIVAWLVIPHGQRGLLLFSFAAVLGIALQGFVSGWYRRHLDVQASKKRSALPADSKPLKKGYVSFVIGLLIVLLFSKFVYIAGMTGYYAFYYMDRYGLPLENAQFCLFVLQAAGMLGTLFGGPLADRFGRKRIIWFSILGTAPFSLLLPYATPFWAIVLSFMIGAILMSGFTVIIVYAQELLPGKVGTVAGLFFGLAFGLGGLGSVVLGALIDKTSVSFVIQLCAFLPLLGAAALLLPKNVGAVRQTTEAETVSGGLSAESR